MLMVIELTSYIFYFHQLYHAPHQRRLEMVPTLVPVIHMERRSHTAVRQISVYPAQECLHAKKMANGVNKLHLVFVSP